MIDNNFTEKKPNKGRVETPTPVLRVRFILHKLPPNAFIEVARSPPDAV